MRARLRVGADAAGVIVRCAGDESGSEAGQETTFLRPHNTFQRVGVSKCIVRRRF